MSRITVALEKLEKHFLNLCLVEQLKLKIIIKEQLKYSTSLLNPSVKFKSNPNFLFLRSEMHLSAIRLETRLYIKYFAYGRCFVTNSNCSKSNQFCTLDLQSNNYSRFTRQLM